jgi:hypothetical protein
MTTSPPALDLRTGCSCSVAAVNAAAGNDNDNVIQIAAGTYREAVKQ